MKYIDPTGHWPKWSNIWGGVKSAVQATVNFVKENIDSIQTGLDVLGMIPVVGEAFDAVNGAIYAARGDIVNAGLSFAACIPVAGTAATGAKLLAKGLDKGLDVVKGMERAADTIKDIDKITDNVHGNSLLTTKPAFGYGLIEKDTGELLKLGETIAPNTRYSQTFLNSINADLKILAQGTKSEMHFWQHNQILLFNDIVGKYPKYNINGW